MKNLSRLMFAVCFVSIIACKDSSEKKADSIETDTSESTEITSSKPSEEVTQSNSFDINKIPVSEADLGNFPYFKLPLGYEYSDPDHAQSTDHKGLITDYDKEYFLNDGIYVSQEGKTFKGHIRLDESVKDKAFSPLELQKSFDDLIAQLGGVKVNAGKGYKSGEKDRIDASDSQANANGYLSSSSYFDNIHTYVIRKPNYVVWVQHNMNRETGYIAVLQTKAFENKMSILKSDQIQKGLNEKGKVVLYINFDTDKATLKPDGNDAVSEITKALQNDKSLKISINGYTDNSGTDNHNLQLSKDRAETVKKAVIAAGIESNRLFSEGFGSKNPIADNSSEDGKAQNRRVELVKK